MSETLFDELTTACASGGADAALQKLAAAKRQLTHMIQRDINHPAVAFWSVSNETDEQHPEVAESNRALIRRARELDPTRLELRQRRGRLGRGRRLADYGPAAGSARLIHSLGEWLDKALAHADTLEPRERLMTKRILKPDFFS